METIKSYTDIEQSKVLAKILPHESADMVYTMINGYHTPFIRIETIQEMDKDDVCAWSLAALLNVLPDGTNLIKEKSDTENEHYMCTVGTKGGIISTFGKNPVDACVAMIEKLHKLKIL